jgi:hypothetical protein
MASSDKSPDMSRVISDLTKSINRLNDKVDGIGGGKSRSASGGRAKESSSVTYTDKELSHLTDTIKATEKVISDLKKGVKEIDHSFDQLHDVHTDAIKGMISNTKLSNKAHEELVDKLHRNTSASSALGNSMMKSSKKLEIIEKKLEETGAFLSDYSHILKEAGAASLESIDDMTSLKKAIQALDSEVELSAEVKEMIRKNEWKNAARSIDTQAKQSDQFREDVKKTSTSFNKLNNLTTSLKTGFSKASDAIGIGFVKEAMVWTGAIGMLTAGAKEIYTQFWSTASAGFGGAFIQLSKTAIGLGISLESLTKITKENMTLIGKMGLKDFTDSLKDTQVQMMQLGLTTEEAAKVKAAMMENARLTGVDTKNKTAMATAAQQQISAFEDLRAVTGESIESLALQTKAIMTDNDNMKLMGAMSKAQRVNTLNDINLERVRLTTMGLSNEAALGVVKAMQAIQNLSVTDRVDAGNGLQAAGSALGIDANKTAQAAAIMRKGRGNQTDSDRALLESLSKEMTAKNDKLHGSDDLNSQMLAEQNDKWMAQLTPINDGMRGANLDRGMSKGEVDANKALGRVPKSVAESSAKIETWLQIINSPLVKIAIGVAGIGALLLKHFFKEKKPVDLPDAIPGGRNKLGAIGKNADGDITSISRSKGGAMPGDSVQGSNRLNSQMTQMAKKNGWTEKQYAQEQGFAGHAQIDSQIRGDRSSYASKQATGAGRIEANGKSIGSSALQAKIAANKDLVAARFVGPPLQPPPIPAVSLSSRARTAASSASSAIGGTVSKVVGGAKGALTGALSSVAGFATKALPFVGLAIAAFQAVQGGMEAVNRAGEIFGVDVNKQALTTAQKVSAGIAGALNAITFGMIPTDETARLLNDVATDGLGVLTDYIESAYEFIYNTAIPAVYGAFKSIIKGIGSAICDVLSPSTWIAMFTGEGGTGGIVQTVLDGIMSGIKFFGTSIAKGVLKIAGDLIESFGNMIPSWLGGDAIKSSVAQSKKDGLLGFASEDTKFGDRDSTEQAKARKEREAKKAKRDGKNSTGSVQGTVPVDDPLGMVDAFGQPLSETQLKGQGVMGTPGVASTPGVNTGGQAAAGKNADGTTINNTTNTTEAPKTASEKILSDILDRMTTLVDLTGKGNKLAEEDMKASSTAGRMSRPKDSGDGYAPSLASFLNMSI